MTQNNNLEPGFAPSSNQLTPAPFSSKRDPLVKQDPLVKEVLDDADVQAHEIADAAKRAGKIHKAVGQDSHRSQTEMDKADLGTKRQMAITEALIQQPGRPVTEKSLDRAGDPTVFQVVIDGNIGAPGGNYPTREAAEKAAEIYKNGNSSQTVVVRERTRAPQL